MISVSAPLREVVTYFLRLGFIAFGGPAAHVALMRRELVAQRKWVDDQEFVDLLGVTNLIPGPNSTEMSMHLGALRAGRWGLWLGGLAFILPAVAIVLALAWGYVRYGDRPAVEGLLFGVQPVVLAIIVQAIWGLRKAAVKGPATLLVVLGAVALVAAGVNQLVVLLGAGVLLLALYAARRGRATGGWPAAVAAGWSRFATVVERLTGLKLAVVGFGGVTPAVWSATPAGYSAMELFLVFLKIGGLLYGSGYVLVSFMQADLVDARGWLTQQELLDAIAVGQFTPGPLFSSATFAGYVIDGWRGAALATAGIFLPSFAFVAITHPLVPRLRRTPWAAPFLDGVNAAAVGLMGLVTFDLAREVTGDVTQVAILAAAAVVLVRWSPNSAFLVLGGALAGLLHRAFI
ncbi:MAG: chromate efflux transporter [Dehalococcoidia bacterium]